MNSLGLKVKKMKTSAQWVDYFKSNLKNQRINWNQAPAITNEAKLKIIKSLKAWQLGETSDGRHLKKAAKKHANKFNDPKYIEAVNLFIKEEQKHGENLGQYIDLLGEERISFNWGDQLFRSTRYLMSSMEIWTVTVLIVESSAQIFYQALKDCSNCNLLKEICTDILIDEARHIDFQFERLAQIFHLKARGLRLPTLFLYSAFYFFVSRVIWMAHSKAFKAGGVDKKSYQKKMKHKYKKTFGRLIEMRLEKISSTSKNQKECGEIVFILVPGLT